MVEDLFVGFIACPDDRSTWRDVEEPWHESDGETFQSFSLGNFANSIEQSIVSPLFFWKRCLRLYAATERSVFDHGTLVGCKCDFNVRLEHIKWVCADSSESSSSGATDEVADPSELVFLFEAKRATLEVLHALIGSVV